jgi:hypothetical protein
MGMTHEVSFDKQWPALVNNRDQIKVISAKINFIKNGHGT